MTLSFDPQSLPVLQVDGHLPRLSEAALQPDALRQRFLMPPTWSPEVRHEPRFSARQPARASVLIALIQRERLNVLLTQRTSHLHDHPGQISFPGGRAEPHDVDAAATALREAQEEVGLNAAFVDVVGALPIYTTGTGFIVTPIIALVRPGFELVAQAFEVAEVFEVPLVFLMNPANHRHHAIEVNGVRREFLSMPWEQVDAEGRSRRYFIWGATAGMLRNLYRFLTA